METKLDITQQLQSMMKDMDMLSDGVAEKAVEALTESGKLIAAEQRRLISSRSNKLPGLIKVGKVKVSKKGSAYVTMGYDSDAIKAAPEGVIIEFGRPGEKSKKVMTQTRNGKKVKVKIGKMESTPHIRRGFDNKQEEAAQIAVDKLNEALKKWGD